MKGTERPLPPVVVIGFGRLGGALALGLKRRKWDVSTLPRSGASVRRAVGLRIPLADHESLKQARIAILAVPDAAIERIAAELVKDLHPSCALVHCAGALTLDVLRIRGETRAVGSLHPLCAVSSPEDSLAGHSAAVSASKPSLLRHLNRMAEALGLRTLKVEERERAAYHAAAVLSAGGLVALLSTAVETMARAGVKEAAAGEALMALMRSALHGVEQRGLSRGLTGPVVRGDVAVVEAHLGAVPKHARAVYRELMLRSLELAGPSLPKPTRWALAKLLER